MARSWRYFIAISITVSNPSDTFTCIAISITKPSTNRESYFTNQQFNIYRSSICYYYCYRC